MSYPLLNIFWTMFEFFMFAIWIWILISVFLDIFRSRDLSGPAKAVWFVVVLFVPLFGILAYLIVRGGSMHERSGRQAGRQEETYRAHVQQTTSDSPGSTADQLSAYP